MSLSNIRSDSWIIEDRTKSVKPFLRERENPFSHSVLIGNWFEERFANEIDQRAIAPAIYGESQCSLEKTLYNNDFKQPIRMGQREEFDEYIRWRQKGFSNRLSSEQTNIQLWDGDQFANNLTTFKDIMYRIKPNEEQKSAEVPLVRRRKQEDYMRGYGNSTKTGLLFWLACEKERDSEIPIDVSHYRNQFKPLNITKRITLHKGTQRRTSV